MPTEIRNLKIGDRFTETGLPCRILIVEKYIESIDLVVARDLHGWGQCFNPDDLVYLLEEWNGV